MRKKKNVKYSEFQNLIFERFDTEKHPYEEMSNDDKMSFDCLVNAPEQYENEEEMLKYAKAHPKATLKELEKYWDSITPDGLPPCASEWDDDDE